MVEEIFSMVLYQSNTSCLYNLGEYDAISGSPQQKYSLLNRIAFIVICALTCECAAGSSGRWVEVGPLSIRMVLFIVALLITMPLVFQNIKRLMRHFITVSLLIFACCICFSVIYGVLRGNPSQNIVEDVKPFLFLLIVPGYMTVIHNEKRLDTLLKAVSYGVAVPCGCHTAHPFFATSI